MSTTMFFHQSRRNVFMAASLLSVVFCMTVAAANSNDQAIQKPVTSTPTDAGVHHAYTDQTEGGVNRDWLSDLQRALADYEYHSSENAHGLQAPNRAHNLRTYFDASGIRVFDRTATGSPELASLSLAGMGHGENLQSVPAGRVNHLETRVEIRRPGVIEWYQNSAQGLEQGFTLPARMEGEGLLVLELEVKHAQASLRGQSIVLTTDTGRRLHYGKLSTIDANGQVLKSYLEVPSPSQVRLVVEDSGASYPIVIDPLLTAVPDALLESNQLGSSGIKPSAFGVSVSGAGDVNGDGFADVVVGAWGWDGGESEEGAAFVFLGSAAGIVGNDPVSAFAKIESNQGASRLGRSVSSAGDVNNDGFDDVIVGAYLYRSLAFFEGWGDLEVRGAAFVYLGSATGIQGAGDPSLSNARILSNELDTFLGWSVSDAGDVNGDGFADIVVGGPRAGIPFLVAGIPPNDRQGNGGAVLVFLGSANGITGTGFADAHKELRPYPPGFPALATSITGSMGFSVSGAGDVNGDLHDDIIVGSTNSAQVYQGSPQGIVGDDPTTTHAMIVSDTTTPVGDSVSGAGDVNNDGFADIVLGAPRSPIPPLGFSPERLGAVLVFHGSPAGITATSPANAQAKFEGIMPFHQLGREVAAAGDVDGDGFDDIIAAALGYAGGLDQEGAAYIFRGGPQGIVGTSLRDDAYVRLESNQSRATINTVDIAVSASGIGDVNGDGFADVMLGTGFYDNGEENEGAAFVFHGGPAPIIANRPPKPDAGADQFVLDIEASGSETITVDGIDSLDPDGTIVSYRWFEGEKLLGTSQRLTTSLSATGRHTLVLTTTDNEGATRGDPVNVSVGMVDTPLVSFDDFGSGGFGGGFGWAGNWVIAGDVSLSSVDSFPTPPQARVGAGATLSRPATLPAGTTGMTLQFNARASQFGLSDQVAVQVSRDGGTFTTLRTFTLADSDDTYKFYGGTVGEGRITLSWYPATAANTMLRFASTATSGHLFVDDIRVTALVAPPGEPLPPTIELPVANAGADITVDDNDTDGFELVTLNGTLSTDADGSILSYQWFEATSAGTFPLGTGAILSTSFAHGSHNLLLIVTDDTGGSSTDTKVVTVIQVFPDNLPPVAIAGPDQTVIDVDGNTLEVVTLDGIASTDTDGTIVSYIWRKNGNMLGNTATFSVTQPIGVHTVDLTVTDNLGATSTDTVVITVVANDPNPTIDSFLATPTTITSGESATLTWTTTDADIDGVSIDNGVGAGLLADGSTAVSPTATTTYILTATGAGGAATSSVTVSVDSTPPASGESLTITRLDYRAGKDEWRIAGTSSIPGPGNTMTVRNGPTVSGAIIGAATVDSLGKWNLREKDSPVLPDSTGTISIQSSQGGIWEGISGVGPVPNGDPPPPPPPAVPTATVDAVPASILTGESSTLSWSSTDAASCSAPWTTSTTTSGTQIVTPFVTTTFDITCTGTGGAASASATVTVSAAPPPPPTAETISVLQAEFRADKGEWRVDGTSSIAGPGNTMTLYIGSTITGTILGTAAVDSLGVWEFREDSSLVPDSSATISTQSSAGGVLEGIGISIR